MMMQKSEIFGTDNRNPWIIAVSKERVEEKASNNQAADAGGCFRSSCLVPTNSTFIRQPSYELLRHECVSSSVILGDLPFTTLLIISTVLKFLIFSSNPLDKIPPTLLNLFFSILEVIRDGMLSAGGRFHEEKFSGLYPCFIPQMNFLISLNTRDYVF